MFLALLFPIVHALNIGGATTFDPGEGFIHSLRGFDDKYNNSINFTYASVGSGKGQTMLLNSSLDVALSAVPCLNDLIQIPLYFLNVRIGINIPLTKALNISKEELIPIFCGLNSSFNVIRIAESYGQTRGLLDFLFGLNATWKSACGNVNVTSLSPPQALKLGHSTQNAIVYGNIANFEFPFAAINGILPTPEALFTGLKFNINNSTVISTSTNFMFVPGYACLLPFYNNATTGYLAVQFVLYLATSGMLDLVNSVVSYPQQYDHQFFRPYLSRVICSNVLESLTTYACIDFNTSTTSVVYIENKLIAIISSCVIGGVLIFTIIMAFILIKHFKSKIHVLQLPPSGLLAFVFSDIEGSTEMWSTSRAEMKKIVSEHNRLAALCSERYAGYIVKYEGDAIFLAFKHVVDAVEYALAFQTLLSGIHIPECFSEIEACNALPIKHRFSATASADAVGRSLRVRIGVHVGEEFDVIQTTKGYDYLGPSINYSARVASFANGGQVLLSPYAVGSLLSEDLEFSPPNDLSVARSQEGIRNNVRSATLNSISGLCQINLHIQTKLNGIPGLQTLYEIVNATLIDRLDYFPRREILVSPSCSPRSPKDIDTIQILSSNV